MARLKMRPPDFLGFYDKMYEWFNDEEDSIFIRQSTEPITREECNGILQLWSKPFGLLFALTREGPDRKDIVGYLAFEQWDKHNGRAFLHVFVDKKWRRRGIMKWAVDRGFKEFFRGKRMRKLKANVPSNNKVMIDFLENGLDLEAEGVQKKELYIDGKFCDVISFSILKEEYAEMISKNKEVKEETLEETMKGG